MRGCYSKALCIGLTLGVLAAPNFGIPLQAGDVNQAPFHFGNDISPILAKVGCSAAECHGGATGQGGFKLSLFAENPALDYEAIVEELDGRRIDRTGPARSLFLRKPTRSGVGHKGGRLLHREDRLYGILHDWIRAGAPFERGTKETLAGLRIEVVEDRCAVTAEFSTDSGRSQRDVTHLAVLQSSNERVGTINEAGQIRSVGPGETWLLARYGKLSARVAFRIPFTQARLGNHGKEPHELDRAWHDRLTQLGLRSVAASNPYTLARRLYFDLTGRPPDPLELEAFVNLPAGERVSRTVDRLLESPEFDRVFARSVAGFFEIPVAGKDPRNAIERNEALRTFFENVIRNGNSLSEVAQKVLDDSVGQTAWRHFADPRDRAEYIGRTMLGMRIGCARCHNHPLDRWTNAEHLAFSAFFTDPRPGPGGMMMSGKFFLPGSGDAVEAELLPVTQRSAPSGLPKDERVAWLVLEGAREQFARNMGNRLFALLVGRGLVELPDDHRLTNPAVHVPMLDVLSRKFLEVDGDLRALVRFIVTADLYAMGSQPPQADAVSGDPELKFLARREARRLTAEELKEAAEFVLGVPIEAEVPPDSPLARQLYMLNSGMLRKGLATAGNQVEAILLFESNPADQLSALYRLILSRPPRLSEQEAFVPLLTGSEPLESNLKDLAFALLASREFGSIR